MRALPSTSVITAHYVDLLLFHHFNTLVGQQDQWYGSASGTVTTRIGAVQARPLPLRPPSSSVAAKIG